MNNYDEQEGDVVKRRRSRWLPGWLKIIIIIYCGIGIALYYLQDTLMLHPDSVTKDEKYAFTIPFKEVNIGYDKNVNINLVQFQHTGSVYKGIVLYFHGNRSNIKRYVKFVPEFTRHGYEVWMIDYPGFGKSTGKFSEKMVYEWSLITYNMARKMATPDSIIFYGKSLGTGIAAELASKRDCKRLILETPYYSMISMANTYFWMYPTKWMIHYKITTHTYLEKVTAPVTIFHGTDDSVIPYSNAKRLKANLKQGDEFITLENGTHNNLNDYPEMQQKLDSLLSR